MTSMMTPRTDALATVHDMSIDELRREYISLKSTGYSLSVEETHLKDKIEVLREESVRAELNAEMKEEQMSNQLFRRLDGAEKEVQRYKAMLKDEESEAETLTARIKKMQNEKNEVENVLEERQEYLLMNLQRKLLETARRKTSVEQELMLERQRYLDMLVTRLDALRGRGSASASADSSMVRMPSEAPAGGVVSPGGSAPPEKHVDAAAASSSHPVEGAEAATSASTTPLKSALPESPSASLAKSAPSSSSLPKIPAREAAAAAVVPHPLTLTPSTRPSLAGTPRSGDLTPVSSHSSETHHAVVALERKLNQLLLEQAAAMQRTSATEKQCAELGAKLRSVQEATFLDRARASKLKEELKESRARLAEANNASMASTSVVGDASFEDSVLSGVSTRSFDPSVSLTMNNLSLRERTRELLSSIPPAPMN